MAMTIFFCILTFLAFCGVLGGKTEEIRTGSLFALAICVGAILFCQLIQACCR